MPNVLKNQNAEVSHNPKRMENSQLGTLSSAIDHFVPRHGELRSWAIPLL